LGISKLPEIPIFLRSGISVQEELYISEKEEVYTYDEILFIKNCNNEERLEEKLELLAKAVKDNKKTSAIFFMPKASYEISSLFQGDILICEIEKSDIQNLLDSLKCKEASFIQRHIFGKLKTLLEYLQEGNSVYPVVIQADCLKKINPSQPFLHS